MCCGFLTTTCVYKWITVTFVHLMMSQDGLRLKADAKVWIALINQKCENHPLCTVRNENSEDTYLFGSCKENYTPWHFTVRTLSKSNRFRTRKLQNNNISLANILRCSHSKKIGFWQKFSQWNIKGVVFFTCSLHLIFSPQTKQTIFHLINKALLWFFICGHVCLFW